LHESTNSSSDLDFIWAVVLAGGVGSRFWPVSTPARPKQLLPLGTDRPLIVDTVERILPLVPPARLRILTGAALAGPILGPLPMLGPENLMVEPVARGTAPVLTWAAFEMHRRDPDAVMLSLHADHVIDPPAAFRDQLATIAAMACRHDRLFTIGIAPTRPETGYGYVRLAAGLEDSGSAVFEVAEFVEKPDRATAEGYLTRGDFLWNSGIFVWRAATLLEEIRQHTPEIARLLPHLENGDVDRFFAEAPNLSIDEAVLERSDRVAVARAAFGWDDVGTWDAVGRTRASDVDGNVALGQAHLVDSRNCIAWCDQGSVVLFGADDLVVVRTAGVTFVAPRSRTADLKILLSRIPDPLRRLED